MNKNQKVTLFILLFSISMLIILIIIYNYSFSNINLENNNTTKKTEIQTTSFFETTTTSKNIITKEEITTKETTKTIYTTKTANEFNKNNVATSITTKNSKEDIGLKEEVIDEMYYYKWTNENERDYTGRNCLFIYDKDGNIVSGEVDLLYYGEYKKTQFITDSIDNCFLEDMYSTQVLLVRIEGKEYEQ